MSSAEPLPTICMARQPIYDRRTKLFAYELLYRDGNSTQAGVVGDSESAASIARSIIEIGLDKLVGPHLAFINIPASLLSHPSLGLIPIDRAVLEILEDTEPSEENLKAVKVLTEKGYKFALDDFVFGSPQEAFLPFCKYVKVDIVLNRFKPWAHEIQGLKKQRLRVLAEKVETMEELGACQAAGCDYFQGYFFAKPVLVSGRGVPQSRSVLVHLLCRLQDPMVTLDEVEELVSADVTLTYRLLRLVNTARENEGKYVDSVRAALVVLGFERVVALVSLLALSGVTDKPSELLTTAMVRAKMCEGVAATLGYGSYEKHFTVGLLSVIEAMFDTPINELLEQLPLATDLKEALTNPDALNPLAESLRIVYAFEKGHWDDLPQLYQHAKSLSRSYLEAVDWAEDANQTLAAA